MRIQSMGFALLVFGFGYLLLAGGCSEESPTAEGDKVPPVISFVHPLEEDIYGARIIDSVEVSLRVTDNSAIEQVQIWALFNDTTSTALKIGPALTQPNQDGFYTFHWDIAGIDNGTTGVLYAIATDRAGNSGSTPKVRVLIVNQSQAGPPRCAFQITPSEGLVTDTYTFDPTLTRDLEEDIDIVVRWDFQNDGRWDIDTSRVTSTAAHIVEWTYTSPDTYTVVMEAFNSYYSIPYNRPCRTTRTVVVKPAEGAPRPPAYHEFVQVPSGHYPIGALACDDCGPLNADEELPGVAIVNISSPYFIDKYEVRCSWYVEFLNQAKALGQVSFDLNSLEVRSADGRVYMVLNSNLTRIKYSVADEDFYVDQRFENHPVTGVTWYGATAYANFFGLRLPTEVEWEVAARSQAVLEGYMYPWSPLSQVIDGYYANFRGSGDPFEEPGAISTTPVGYYDGSTYGGFATIDARSLAGTYDQAGNVAEWIKDWYAEATLHDLYQAYVADSIPQSERPPAFGNARVLRGASYTNWPGDLRVTNRMAAEPYRKAPWIGFRTAYINF